LYYLFCNKVSEVIIPLVICAQFCHFMQDSYLLTYLITNIAWEGLYSLTYVSGLY